MTLDVALDYLEVAYLHYFNLQGLAIAVATWAAVYVLDELDARIWG